MKQLFIFAGFTFLPFMSLGAQTQVASNNPFSGAKLYVDPTSDASVFAAKWKKSRPQDAAIMERIATQPSTQWFGDWNRNIKSDVARAFAQASKAGALPVFVAYNIPGRDCGQYSRGGASGMNKYRKWIREFAAGLKGQAVVILEPDAVAQTDCLKGTAKDERFAMLRDAIAVLKSKNTAVYIDAGNPKWIPSDDMAGRLMRAGIEQADGFTLNVSNFISTASNIAYGERISKRVGGKHFLIDTSRNGTGGLGGEWCNPAGQAVGAAPNTRTGHPLVDAYLWIKRVGESDGQCNGGPRAGEWWPEYALGLGQANVGLLVSVR